MRIFSKTKMMLVAMALSVFAAPAFAQDMGAAATNVFGQLTSVADVVTAVIFLAGLGVGAAAAFKFKAHSDNAQQVPLKVPMFYAIVAALLIGLPAFLSMGKSTIFGADGEVGGMDTGVYNKIE